MKKFLPLAIFIILLNIIALGTHKIANQQAFAKNDYFPQFSLPHLLDENQTFNNQNIKQQYALINFFASWCSSCRLEHDFLMELKNNPKINLYGIAWRDIDFDTQRFLKNLGNPYKIVATDSKNKLGKNLGVKGTPESFLIDKNGKIIFHYRGPLDDFEINKIKRLISGS